MIRNVRCNQIKQTTFIDSLNQTEIMYIPPSTQCHMMVRSSCIQPVNPVPHGGQIIVPVRSSYILPVNTVPHGWSDHRALPQSTRYHMVGQITCILPVITVPHGWSYHRAFYQSTQYHVVVQIESLRGKRRDSILSEGPSIIQGSATPSVLVSSGERDPNFLWEIFNLDTKVYKVDLVGQRTGV